MEVEYKNILIKGGLFTRLHYKDLMFPNFNESFH